ncbi:MAG: HAMP domain-containing protein, partial [Deltaproteobacteria bacterium]|nr:HAMP domain-containing protein [Deltaproteobacteria bacterium]
RLSLYFFMPVFFASFAIGLGLTIIEAMDRLLPLGTTLPQRQEIEYLRWYIKAATLGGAAIAVATGLLIAFALNRPLKRLEGALQNIASGSAEELDIGATNEFASLSKSFNTAVAAIKQSLLTAKTGASDEAVQGLERLERLAVLGGISAVIAHEIKNPLASIKGLTQLMAEKAEGGSDAKKYTSVMLEEIDRLNKVADNLLYLAKPAKDNHRYYDIKSLLNKAADNALAAANKKIEILKEPDETPIEIWMDSDRLERAFLNLLINAIQASAENNPPIPPLSKGGKGGFAGGIVAITVEKHKDKVSVKITNKGSFIPAEDRDKIFEPFYTTKGKKGTGLGLAVARHIVLSHSGDIKIESNKEETTFIVELPLHAGSGL